MIDGQLRRVVMFPDDGHPDLASEVRTSRATRGTRSCCGIRAVWIYTQDRPASGSSVYRPARNPHYNDSNYRSTVSLPAAAGGR